MKSRTNKVPVKKSILKSGKPKAFTIVAIGASTGGLEAMSILLQNLPINTGMAFIYVQHLSPFHKSSLTSLLANKTKMKVQEIENMEVIKPNNIYIIPHNKGIKVTDGHIKLIPRAKDIPPISIDVLFCSLAQTHKSDVIGVILSGNGQDGTIGLKAIKEAGGLTLAQDSSAPASSMPKSAIASGVVDFILSPKKIAHELLHLSQNHFRSLHSENIEEIISDNDPYLKSIFELLYNKTGVDFNHYKTASIKRRLTHKMNQSGATKIKDYAKLLVKKKDELDILYKDLLINVTNFFRDPETFQYLKTSILPKLIKNKPSQEMFRIWVPACSTGEEAYSIAMLMVELQEKSAHKFPVQIFATDLSEGVIHDARIGKYTRSDIEHISPKRINRFFTKSGDNYYVIKELREMCVFAPHNILRDPPFFKIDFISCRNLLIYFDIPAQKKILSIMHFALGDGKYMMLGKAENIGSSTQLFTQLNSKHKIYTKKKHLGVRNTPPLDPHFSRTIVPAQKISQKKNLVTGKIKLDSIIDSVLLANYMPACAIINKDMDILQFRGSTSLYLSHPSGKASLNILKMTRPEFAIELRNAIHEAVKKNKTIHKSNIEIKVNSEFKRMSLEVSPLKAEWEEPLLLITFAIQEQPGYKVENGNTTNRYTTLKDQKIKRLTEELNNARVEIHSVIELQEKAYEELQAANEEIVSTNEEFQTLNEELETSKEEVEASNEELISTNHELKMHNELLAESYNYSQTIIDTIHEPMIILDKNLNVKSANRSFYKKFEVKKTETEGKLLFQLGNKQWNIPKLRSMLETMLSKNSPFESFEVTHTFPGIGERIMLLNASRIIQKTHREKLILLAIEDITERIRHFQREKELLKKDIILHEADKMELEKAVKIRTKQLNEKNRELENVNKDLTSFTYISSHDLQEPLRKIQAFIDILMDEEHENLSLNGKKYLTKTNDTANRMRNLIEDLLTYSRTKNTDRKFKKTDLNIVINEVKKDFEEILLTKKATIVTTGLCDAHIISFQFRQLMKNLIGNSLKFSKKTVKTVIKIQSMVVPGTKLKYKNLSSKYNYCHITYRDNGIGFDPQYNERIFEVFQRLHSNEEYKGTGMGLAICKRIIENHNGMITASGKVNRGARFDIYIPILEKIKLVESGG